jgi:hypothetical protein
MELLRSAGLLNEGPISDDWFDMFTPPNAVNWGVFDSLRKLYTLLPPSVWE